MPHSGGRMLSRVRSHRKLRTATAAEVDEQKHHRRQHSDSVSASATGHSSSSSNSLSATRSRDAAAARTHWPPIEWDPLKLNPPTPPVADLPARPRGDSLPGQPKRSLGGGGHERRRPRMHHSDSGFSLLIHDGFDFGFERPEGGGHHHQQQHHHGDDGDGEDDDDDDDDDEDEDEDDVHMMKGWPSPTSSVDSGKSWLEDNDDDDDDDDDGAVKRSNELWGGQAPAARRRPQVASPDDPNYFIQRGGWKRKGIVFGGKTEEVRQKDDEVFNVI